MNEVVDRERQAAERIARDLVVPPRHTGSWHDKVVPLAHGELAAVRSMVEKLTARPETPHEAIGLAADLIDLAGATENAHAIGLWDEFNELARRYPAEFTEATGSDLAAGVTETLIEDVEAPRSAKVGLAIKVRMIRDALAGPRPSAVEFHLAEAASVSWLDYYRCMMQREQLVKAPLREWQYYDRRADQAHRRYVRSLKALAAARRVDLTAIQVNLGDVAAASATSQ